MLALAPRRQRTLDPLATMAAVSKQADTLLAEALGLPAEERVMVAASLLASPDSAVADDTEIDRLWSIETERRAAMLESGEARTFTRDEVLDGLAELRANRIA
jgi:Putative addiction module component